MNDFEKKYLENDQKYFYLNMLCRRQQQGGAAPESGAEQQGEAGQLHQPRLPRAAQQGGQYFIDSA